MNLKEARVCHDLLGRIISSVEMISPVKWDIHFEESVGEIWFELKLDRHTVNPINLAKGKTS